MIRLFELRDEKGLSQRDMAKILNISQGTYNNWENGKTQPSIEQLIMLASFFEVSVDYLVGNTDEKGGLCAEQFKTETERKLLRAFRKLPQEVKESFLSFIEKL